MFSIEKMRDIKGGSLQAPNFRDVTEILTPDDQTVIFVTKQPLAIFLDRLRNRFIVSKVAGDKYGDQLYQNLSAPVRINLSAFSAAAIWFSPAMTTIGAGKQRSRRLFFEKSQRMGRASRHWSPARRTSSTTFLSMKSRDCSVIRASESKGSKGCRCIF